MNAQEGCECEHYRQQILHLTRLMRMQSAVHAAARRIKHRDELLREVCELATQTGIYDRACVALLQPDGRSAEFSSVHGRERLHAERTRATLALPLDAEGARIGALTLTSRSADPPREDELLILEDVAATVSHALRAEAQANGGTHQAHHDPLTGLANRALFCTRLDQQLRLGLPSTNPLLAAFDVHNLNNFNDSFGREFGDLLLQRIAKRLREHAGREERCGYLGTGTFVLLEPDLPREAAAIASLLDSTLFARPFNIQGRSVRISCRCGIARYPTNGGDGGTLVQNAEAALKYAKECGEHYLTYKVAMRSEMLERLALEHRLREGLDAEQFELYYQPQVCTATGRVESLEALLRWNDPQQGLVQPTRFLSVLESTELIVPVGEWALRRALQDRARWSEMGLSPVRVAVNVSPLQVRRPGFVEELLKLIECEGSDSQDCGLDLEITETALMQDPQGTSRRLRPLREAGIRIALDDFGTGYSSLGLLSKLPVDLLKIDRRFVRGVPKDRASVTLTRSILALASGLGLLTVAEGVETEPQLKMLRRFKCNYTQGYLHARALAAAEVETLLARQR